MLFVPLDIHDTAGDGIFMSGSSLGVVNTVSAEERTFYRGRTILDGTTLYGSATEDKTGLDAGNNALHSTRIPKRRHDDDQNNHGKTKAPKGYKKAPTGPQLQSSATGTMTLAASLISGSSSSKNESRRDRPKVPQPLQKSDNQAQTGDKDPTRLPGNPIQNGTVHRQQLRDGRTRYSLQYSMPLKRSALETLSGLSGAYLDQIQAGQPDFSTAAPSRLEGAMLKAVRAGGIAAFQLEFTTTAGWFTKPEGRLLELLRGVKGLPWPEVYEQLNYVFADEDWSLDDLKMRWKTKGKHGNSAADADPSFSLGKS